MTVTVDSFLALHDEFERIDPAVISGWIAIAVGRCSAPLYGGRLDEAVMWLTAHFLWVSPSGNSLRLDGDQGSEPKKKSRYWLEFLRINRELGLGFMVVQ